MQKIIFFVLAVFLLPCILEGKERVILKTNSIIKSATIENAKPAIIIPKRTKIINPQAEYYLEELRKYYVVEVADKKTAEGLLRKFCNNKEVNNVFISSPTQKIEQDKVKVNDTNFDRQWYLNYINVPEAWTLSTGKDVVIAVIDTGIDPTSKEFEKQLWINSGEDINHNGVIDISDFDGIDNDGNGYVDDIIGYDFIDNYIISQGDTKDIDGYPYDEHGHGTMVSGVIAAKTNNDFGIAGIAYNAKIMTLRTHNAEGMSEPLANANAIVYAALNGAKVINMSFGEYEDSPILHTAIKFAYAMGCVMVASAGNDGLTRQHFPSSYEEVISVGGCNQQGHRLYNYGDKLDITAPASNIYTTTKNNSFRVASGTSFAAPIVSAISAMLLEQDSTLTPSEIKGILQTTATKINDAWTSEFGAGIVNAYQALNKCGKSLVEITSPKNNECINISKIDTLPVFGTAFTPLFKSYILRIRKGIESSENTNSWDTLATENDNAVIDSVLGNIALQDYVEYTLDSTQIYTISLLINLKNSQTFESRSYINLFSNACNLQVTEFKIYQPFYNSERVPLFNIQTNMASLANIYYRIKGDTAYKIVISNEYLTTNHTVYVPDIPIDKEIEGYVEVFIGDGKNDERIVSRKDFEFYRISDYFSQYTFQKKKYSLPPNVNLYRESYDIVGMGKSQLFVNYVNDNGYYDKLKLIYLEDTTFHCIDSTQSVEYIQAVGDINSDGKLEFITGKGYEQVSTIYKDNGNKIFGSQIYQKNEFCEGVYDFDGDRENEVLYFDYDNTYSIYKVTDGSLQNLCSFNLNKLNSTTDSTHYKFSTKRVAVGNFVSINNQLIAISPVNNKNIFIINIYNNIPKIVDSIEIYNNYYKGSSQSFITAGDIDGDGIDEIVYLGYGKINDTSGILGKYEMWNCVIYKYKSGNFIKIYDDYFWGVVNDNNAFNSINVCRLDNEDGAEVAISIYPNLYVLKWDFSDNKVIPLWNYNISNSNTMSYGDFDGNNLNEIVFSNLSETVFYEFDTNIMLEVPYVKGYSVNSTTLHLEWKDVSNEYFVRLTSNNDTLYYSTVDNFIDINNLEPNKKYIAYVGIKNNELLSKPLILTTKEQTIPILVTPINDRLIKIKFSERLAITNTNSMYKLQNISEQVYLSTGSIVSINDSSLIVEFTSLSNGNYILFIPSLFDCYGNPTKSGSLSLEINNDNFFELYLKKLQYIPKNTLIITFSEEIDKNSAENVNNYELHPIGDVITCKIVDLHNIKITLRENYLKALGKDYILTAKNIIAKSGNLMTKGAGNSLGFTIATSDLSNSYIYPNPIRKRQHNEAYVANITNNCFVEILDVTGNSIKKLEENDGNGGIRWNLQDKLGNECVIGVYYIHITNENEETYIKFAITE